MHRILGLHHVTATVDDAQQDLDFCLGALGLRLVKKTVNFDNHYVYHFYYGTERGVPGTIWTTFPYKGHGVRPGRHGSEQVVATSFSVPAGLLGAWTRRLESRGASVTAGERRFDEQVLAVRDPSGLAFEIVANDRDAREPWTGALPADEAIRGLHSVTAVVRDATGTVDLMTGVLGYRITGESGPRTRLAAGGDRPGHFIDVVADADLPRGVNGIGTVHHVAMAIGSDDEQVRLRDDLLRAGLVVTPVRDRCYFHSIYFREPGGVLFEVATVAPGFTDDEDLASLGRDLKLPPWEEPNRADIEPRLAAVRY